MEDLGAAMDANTFEIGGENDGNVLLRLICSDGVEYEGNPLHLHSHVLNKSKFFQARLSERWSLNSSTPEIKLTVLPNGVAENYIKCIRLMYLSYKGKGLYFSGVDEALDIFAVASELLFEEGIQACMHYLEAVPWTPEQSHKIKSLLSSAQVSVSSDLSARFGIPNSLFNEELELLRKKLPEMFSTMWRNKPHMIPQSSMLLTIKRHMIENFQGNEFPAMQEVCRDTIMNEFNLKVESIKNTRLSSEGMESDCENLIWLIDVTKLCNIGIFETTLKILVEDSQLPDILMNKRYQSFSRSFSNFLLQILVDRYMKGLANGDIIIPRSFRISFLRMWVPVMAYHICNIASSYSAPFYGSCLTYSESLVGSVTKMVGTLPLDDQKALFMFWKKSLKRFGTQEKEVFQWWIDSIWLAVTSVNKVISGLSDGE